MIIWWSTKWSHANHYPLHSITLPFIIIPLKSSISEYPISYLYHYDEIIIWLSHYYPILVCLWLSMIIPLLSMTNPMTNIHCYAIYKSIIVHDNLFVIIPSLSHYHDHPPYDNDEEPSIITIPLKCNYYPLIIPLSSPILRFILMSHWLSSIIVQSYPMIIPLKSHSIIPLIIIEGSLEVKLPTIWTDEKQRREESERREE